MTEKGAWNAGGAFSQQLLLLLPTLAVLVKEAVGLFVVSVGRRV